MKKDLDKLKRQVRSWCPGDLTDAKIIQWKGNFPGYAGYRQKGRALARGAKRRRTRINRRIDRILCDE